MEADHQRAREIRQAWHARLADIDPLLVPLVARQHYSKQSWDDKVFAAQQIGLRRALEQGQQQGLAVEANQWVLSAEAYDLGPEPLYQYLVQCTLNGIWFDGTPEERAGISQGTISARATLGWALSRQRGEPRGASSTIGWVSVPYAWDDLMQLLVEGFLSCHQVTAPDSLTDVVTRLQQRSSAQTFAPALACWQGVAAKLAVGMAAVAPQHERDAVAYLLRAEPGLCGGHAHQSGMDRPALGNVIAHLGVAYTVAHETGHVLAARWHPDRKSAIRQDLQAWEVLADQLALRALWNYNGATLPHTTAEDTEELLLLISGIVFCMMVYVFESGQLAGLAAAHAAATPTGPARDPREHVKDRLRSFVAAASTMALALRGQDQARMAAALAQAHQFAQAFVPYVNACIDWLRQMVSPAIQRLNAEFLPAFRQ